MKMYQKPTGSQVYVWFEAWRRNSNYSVDDVISVSDTHIVFSFADAVVTYDMDFDSGDSDMNITEVSEYGIPVYDMSRMAEILTNIWDELDQTFKLGRYVE